MTCYLDMDGVLVNFVAGACAAHNRSWPYYLSANLGVFDIEKIWKISPEEFWAPLDKPGFWANLQSMPEAIETVRLVEKKFGGRIAVLTSPSESMYCVPEKRQWMEIYFPQFVARMIFTGAKEFVAGSGRILLDDRDENITKWRQAGGVGITVPRPWNKLYGVDVMDHLITCLENHV